MTAVLPFSIVPAPAGSRVAGVVVSLLGQGLFYIGLMCLAAASAYIFIVPVAFFLDIRVFYGLLATAPIVVLGIRLLPIGIRTVVYGRRMRTKDAITVLTHDPRAPVLYLRSFDDEDLPDPTFRAGSRNPFIPVRYEEQIVLALVPIGPVISIGIPGETRPELGAARLYVREEHWREAVRYFAQKSAAIVIVVGRTQSLWWEIDFVLSTVLRERLLFFFPYADDRGARRAYWRAFYEAIPHVVPRLILERMERERQGRYQLFRDRVHRTVPTLPAQLGSGHFLDFREASSSRLLVTKRPLTAWFYSWIFPKSVGTWIDARATLRPFVEKVRRLPLERSRGSSSQVAHSLHKK